MLSAVCCPFALQALVSEAAAALENPQLVGQPMMPEEGAAGAAQRTGAAGGGIDMGT